MSNDVTTAREERTKAVWKVICDRYKTLRAKNPNSSRNAICTKIAWETPELLNEPKPRTVQNILTIVKTNGLN